MAPAAQQITWPAEEQVKTPVIENRAPSVGHLFRNRVEQTPDRRGLPLRPR